MRDRMTGVTTREDIDPAGNVAQAGEGDAANGFYPTALSYDGRYLLGGSRDFSGCDPSRSPIGGINNECGGAFVRDRVLKTTTFVADPRYSVPIAMSRDGRYVVFRSVKELVPHANVNCGSTPVDDAANDISPPGKHLGSRGHLGAYEISCSVC